MARMLNEISLRSPTPLGLVRAGRFLSFSGGPPCSRFPSTLHQRAAPGNAADGRRKRPRWGTSSWLIDGNKREVNWRRRLGPGRPFYFGTPGGTPHEVSFGLSQQFKLFVQQRRETKMMAPSLGIVLHDPRVIMAR